MLEKEKDKFLDTLRHLEQDIANFDQEKYKKDIDELEEKKLALAKKLEELEQEETAIDQTIEDLAREEEQLVKEENEYWEAENQFEYKVKNHLEDNAQMKNQWKSKNLSKFL
jgi:chromosome segregation ATPase